MSEWGGNGEGPQGCCSGTLLSGVGLLAGTALILGNVIRMIIS